MSFKGSVTYIAAGQVTANLPMMVDSSGNSPSQCTYSHFRINPASSAVTVTTTFDNRPGVNYSTVGIADVYAIPVGAKVMTVTPAGGTATAVLGRDS